ncbi:hypothetical protein IGI04_024915 [Brassica rapa subsp. trilocularis]|uniref:FBD domain-containing protein n=1 Tax=Brassica rapa subsp. trilocularis TaxID=1813537 RepID=A0ABQ7M842_BRACM|nr:hypothetical protein IGI04_024915 [Brassica rapa subsp. trilocularis]
MKRRLNLHHTVSGMKISSDTLEVIHAYSKLEQLPQLFNLSWLYASFLESFWVPSFLGCRPDLHTLAVLWTPVTTRTSSKMKLAMYFLRNCHVLEKLTLSESFLDMIKNITKVQRKSSSTWVVVACDPPSESETCHLVYGSEKGTKRFTRQVSNCPTSSV